MAAERYYYSDSITDFLRRGTDEIVGALARASGPRSLHKKFGTLAAKTWAS